MGWSPQPPYNSWGRIIISSGRGRAVQFVEWTPGQQAILENEHYSSRAPYLDRIMLKTMKDATTRIGAVRTGELPSPT